MCVHAYANFFNRLKKKISSKKLWNGLEGEELALAIQENAISLADRLPSVIILYICTYVNVAIRAR